ncbi:MULTISPECIES: ABC transporter substrate-binding protein [Paenibacillus]|uniref:ABC transporter substrate-binding protein n=1 Tax=Paenibacillus TaxID=44249 RepID=UPI00041802F5|nr:MULTISPECIES: ABC transporter substrate-binding protein [Paenibacillus]KGP80615.1 ABC transporter substrate-binding protein [Paenibacillus sp. MAEPY2]KGP86096.1 ABC transporter substrate-binding protein [Paenibacillus sp. MAEPY1]OZQ73413.1 ABC transporter substrate-binding protein [Paenibacillus taichungensis]HBU82232.1 ABC transporter substrate-binding protein [Paenibacillus sp.]
MHFSKFMLILAMICVVIAEAGCSSSSTSGGEPSADSQGKVNLVFWSHQEDAIVGAYKKLISKYQSLHPDVTIEYQTFPYDVYSQKLKASFSAKKPPDIAEFFGTWVPEYSKNNLLVEIPDSENVKKAYYDAPLGGYLRDNKLYGLPLEYNIENGGMLIHPQMLKEQGLDHPPTSWTELVDYAQKLTVRESGVIKVKGFDFVSADNITFTFLSLILQQGVSFMGEDGHVNFHTPEAQKAMSTLVSLVADDKVADLTTFGGELDTSDYFFQGKSAMTYRGPWTIAAGQNNYKVDDFEYVSVPSFTENPPVFAAESGWGLAVSKQSKQQEAALDFIQFISEKDNLTTWNTDTFTVPAKKEIAENPEFLKNNPHLKPSLAILALGQWIGPIADRDFFFKQINDNFQLMAGGQQSVEDGLMNIERTINDNQDQHK